MTINSSRFIIDTTFRSLKSQKNTTVNGIMTIDMAATLPTDQKGSDPNGRSATAHIHDCTGNLSF
jgi:hypothetical protein